MKIPLFDNDFTLVKGQNKAHLDSFDYAIKQAFNLDVDVREFVAEGMIDNQIIIDLLKQNGIPEEKVKEKLDQVRKTAVEYFMEHENEGDSSPMPGAHNLLKEIKQKGGLVGVLTGNIAEIGFRKLEIAGLRSFIDFGAFGNEAFRRVDLVSLALERAKKLKTKVVLNDLILVADSLRDVKCAKDAGVEIIAVTSGKNTAEELQKAEADYVVNSLLEKDKILGILGI